MSRFKEYMMIVNEAEMDSKPNPKLVAKALAKVTKEGNDYLITMVKGMNPKKLSVADIDTLNDIIGS